MRRNADSRTAQKPSVSARTDASGTESMPKRPLFVPIPVKLAEAIVSYAAEHEKETFASLGRRFKVSLPTAGRYLRRAKLVEDDSVRVTKEERELMFHYFEYLNMPPAHIGFYTGRHLNTVHRQLATHFVGTKGLSRITEELMEAAVRRYVSGDRTRLINSELGVSGSSLYPELKRRGISEIEKTRREKSRDILLKVGKSGEVAPKDAAKAAKSSHTTARTWIRIARTPQRYFDEAREMLRTPLTP